jgi:hypothetical protein
MSDTPNGDGMNASPAKKSLSSRLKNAVSRKKYECVGRVLGSGCPRLGLWVVCDQDTLGLLYGTGTCQHVGCMDDGSSVRLRVFSCDSNWYLCVNIGHQRIPLELIS